MNGRAEFSMTIHISIALVAGMVCAVTPALAAPKPPLPAGDAMPVMGIDTASFLAIVIGANRFEIESSQRAKEKSKAADVISLADMIVSDHNKAGDRLNALLTSKGVTPDSDPPMAPKHEKMLSQLDTATGDAFDMLYIDMQAQAHMEAVALFRTYAGAGEDQSLVGFAKETLPRLETHLGHVAMIIKAH
jgi:putative membrane protein